MDHAGRRKKAISWAKALEGGDQVQRIHPHAVWDLAMMSFPALALLCTQPTHHHTIRTPTPASFNGFIQGKASLACRACKVQPGTANNNPNTFFASRPAVAVAAGVARSLISFRNERSACSSVAVWGVGEGEGRGSKSGPRKAPKQTERMGGGFDLSRLSS